MVFGKIKNNILKFIFKKGYKATRYPFLVGIFLMQLILSNQIANAQSISLDQEWRTDLMRREQLLGRFDSAISFLINTNKLIILIIMDIAMIIQYNNRKSKFIA